MPFSRWSLSAQYIFNSIADAWFARAREEEVIYVLTKMLHTELWPNSLWNALFNTSPSAANGQPGKFSLKPGTSLVIPIHACPRRIRFHQRPCLPIKACPFVLLLWFTGARSISPKASISLAPRFNIQPKWERRGTDTRCFKTDNQFQLAWSRSVLPPSAPRWDGSSFIVEGSKDNLIYSYLQLS